MRALLALALLPACFIAPDRPQEMLPTGRPLTLLPAGCLDINHPLDPGTVGRLPSGRDALFRTEFDGVHAPRVYEFTLDRPTTCYALAFDVPSSTGPVAAMDISVVGSEVLIAIMTEELGGALLVEVALDGATGSVLSSTPTSIGLAPPVVTSNRAPTAGRFLRRMPATHELWFGSLSAGGGTSEIGVAAEASPGMLGTAALYPVRQSDADNELWLDAFPLAMPAANGSTAVLVGEAETCAAVETEGPADLDCDPALLRPNDMCSMQPERCPARRTHVLSEPALVGYSAAQPDSDFLVEMIAPDAQAQVAALGSPSDVTASYVVAGDVALSASGNQISAVALWYADLGETLAVLGFYPTLAPGPRLETIATLPLATAPSDLRAGSFTADAPQVLAIGATAGAVQCVAADGSFADCTPQ